MTLPIFEQVTEQEQIVRPMVQVSSKLVELDPTLFVDDPYEYFENLVDNPDYSAIMRGLRLLYRYIHYKDVSSLRGLVDHVISESSRKEEIVNSNVYKRFFRAIDLVNAYKKDYKPIAIKFLLGKIDKAIKKMKNDVEYMETLRWFADVMNLHVYDYKEVPKIRKQLLFTLEELVYLGIHFDAKKNNYKELEKLIYHYILTPPLYDEEMLNDWMDKKGKYRHYIEDLLYGVSKDIDDDFERLKYFVKIKTSNVNQFEFIVKLMHDYILNNKDKWKVQRIDIEHMFLELMEHGVVYISKPNESIKEVVRKLKEVPFLKENEDAIDWANELLFK